MINRRDLIIGGACLTAAAGAEAMRPKKRVSLLPEGAKLADMVPKSFGKWAEGDSSGIVTPQTENSLAAKLYNQELGRIYERPDGAAVMLLIAYGNTQSDTLQLHRPEVCYPAFGFAVTENQAAAFPAGPTRLPGRNLVAAQPGREERISYWTRIGEFLPVDNRQQREMRFRTALAGIIPDGVLVRISNTLPGDADPFGLNAAFIAELLTAVAPALRPALITTDKARAFAAGRAG